MTRLHKLQYFYSQAVAREDQALKLRVRKLIVKQLKKAGQHV